MVDCAGLENRKQMPATSDPIATYDVAEKRLSPALLLNLENHADLADVVKAWPELPDDVRKMIAGVVRLTPKRVDGREAQS